MTRNRRNLAPALAGLGLATLLFSPALQTQAQGPGGFGGGPGGFNRRPPFAFGTVTAVDAGAGTITISSPFGGGSQTIQTQGATPITTESDAKVSDLKVGDQVQVQGVPTGITAATLTIGQAPFPIGGPGGGPGGPGGGRPAGGGGGPAQPFAVASGTVASLKPLTITLSASASLTLTLPPGAKVTRYTALALSGVKVGDQVAAQGQAGTDGTFSATAVAVNVSLGGRGMGGMNRGGRGMGGRNTGPGGPGGFGGGNGMPPPPDGNPGPPPPGGDPGPPPPMPQ